MTEGETPNQEPRAVPVRLADFLANNVWAVAPVEEVPELRLVRWQVYEVGGARHFVGYNTTEGGGRVSSAILRFDPEARRGVTRSGRVYELVGPSGSDPDARYTFGVWLRHNGFESNDAVPVPLEALARQEPDAS